MKVSDNGLDFIKKEEGSRNTLYDDKDPRVILDKSAWAKGNATIGFGHLVSKTDAQYDGVVLTKQQIDRLLREDIEVVEEVINQYVKVPLNQNQFDALASLIFNVGMGRVNLRDGIIMLKSGNPSTLLRHLNAGEYASAAKAFLDWKYAFGKPLLMPRRLREYRLFMTAVAPDDSPPELA